MHIVHSTAVVGARTVQLLGHRDMVGVQGLLADMHVGRRAADR